ncbi:CopG family ribbon-helix-helix protein [Halosolutus gelatinilyticus]|uniref:CopG family ribbon-helix-helix protein n=1 Tax=Halosolutus gelatinilyticus TaxID=2931975 RepID=UPI001FF29CF8|nr:CopG family ribbon-helix-helix protein [Halosolutus gelatinilyticus]
MAVVSVSMPDALLEQLDALAKEYEYTGRSEVVREAARSLLAEFDAESLEDSTVAGIVSVRYPFGTRSVERRLTELRHDHDAGIVSNDHSHVDDYCLEVFVLESDPAGVSAFVSRCRSIADVDRVDYSLVPLDGVERLQET